MLQQTQVDRVVPKYVAFLARFPDLTALACAPLADVLRSWSGLGYNSRAKRLRECARTVAAKYGSVVPSDPSILRTLPGIGRYTACAVSSFAFGAKEPVVDVNVRRVLSRTLLGRDGTDDVTAWSLAELALPRRDCGAWSEALMDLGALFCRAVPKCATCPARRACAYAICGSENAGRGDERRTNGAAPDRRRNSSSQKFAGSRRFYRGRVVRALAGSPSLSFLALGEQVKDGFAKSDLPWLRELLSDLERDGLVALDTRGSRAALP